MILNKFFSIFSTILLSSNIAVSLPLNSYQPNAEVVPTAPDHCLYNVSYAPEVDPSSRFERDLVFYLDYIDSNIDWNNDFSVDIPIGGTFYDTGSVESFDSIRINYYFDRDDFDISLDSISGANSLWYDGDFYQLSNPTLNFSYYNNDVYSIGFYYFFKDYGLFIYDSDINVNSIGSYNYYFDSLNDFISEEFFIFDIDYYGSDNNLYSGIVNYEGSMLASLNIVLEDFESLGVVIPLGENDLSLTGITAVDYLNASFEPLEYLVFDFVFLDRVLIYFLENVGHFVSNAPIVNDYYLSINYTGYRGVVLDTDSIVVHDSQIDISDYIFDFDNYVLSTITFNNVVIDLNDSSIVNLVADIENLLEFRYIFSTTTLNYYFYSDDSELIGSGSADIIGDTFIPSEYMIKNNWEDRFLLLYFKFNGVAYDTNLLNTPIQLSLNGNVLEFYYSVADRRQPVFANSVVTVNGSIGLMSSLAFTALGNDKIYQFISIGSTYNNFESRSFIVLPYTLDDLSITFYLGNIKDFNSNALSFNYFGLYLGELALKDYYKNYSLNNKNDDIYLTLNFENLNLTSSWFESYLAFKGDLSVLYNGVPIQNVVYDVIDIPGVIFTILSLPFSFISTGFGLTMFPGTPYSFNLGSILISLLVLSLVITLIVVIVKAVK